LTAWPENVR